MAGFAHIIRIGVVEDSAGIRVPEYQFTYNDGTSTFARTVDEAHLIEFLSRDIAITADELDRVLTGLRTEGRSTIVDLEIPEHETAILGLQQVASDV